MSEVITISSDNEDNCVETLKKSCSSTKHVPHEVKNGNSKSLSPGQGVSGYSRFEDFLKYCTDVEINKRGGSAQSMKVIEEKILLKYKETDPDYLKSEAFEKILILARNKVEREPSRLFVHMKEVSDELKLRSTKKKEGKKRKSPKNENEPQSKRTKEETVVSEDSTCENEVAVNKRHVEKLERLFQKVYRKVKKLEEKEVDWDDEHEENSSFIKWSRYSNRLYRIWEKLQEAKGNLEAAKRLKSNRIAFAGTHYPKLNQVIENFVNKTQKFPDFHDILKLTTETLNQERKTNDEIRTIASSAFQTLGNQLQKCRVFDFWNSFLTYLPEEKANAADPAENDEVLTLKLKENQKKAETQLDEVMKKYVDEQISQKLEPEEVPPDVDDDNSKSAGEDGNGDSEEEEEPEDIIAISSSCSKNFMVNNGCSAWFQPERKHITTSLQYHLSLFGSNLHEVEELPRLCSDESENESTKKAKQEVSNYENGDVGESTDIDVEGVDKVTKEVAKVKEERVDSIEGDSVLTAVKKSFTMEDFGSIASCSFVVKSKVENSDDDDIVEISD